uniref:Uncharacterized protein n=1 Tax=viral metagenome TaxID=1070528 RepID=A0A6M3LN63_9ZZZZ
MQMTVEMQLKCLEIRRDSAANANRTYDVNAIGREISFLTGILEKAEAKAEVKSKAKAK